MQVRALTRKSIEGVRQTKQATTDARAEVDTLRLRLQNLEYEQRHLRGEIQGCEGYEHKYQQLSLIPEDEFLVAFPDYEALSEHDLMGKRIEHEHTERQQLEEKRLGLVKRKQELAVENSKKKDELAALDKELERYIEGAKAVQKVFEKGF
ncbi:hypothetical protein LTS18_012103 [Coniosporium uncinatum]|uniref:Uncharacterized protein n=1 Tax=Coniosporium uncinatum TaxID=93489 RepID=A0ACC3CXS4_9PEZI|nr:hypothetical protein LTS18_012103 [Coniosporium uncinatum]